MGSEYLLTGGSGILGTELQKYLYCFSISSKDWDLTDGAPLFFYNRFQRNLRNVSTIIHTGAYTDVPGAEVDKKQVIETNILGTKYVKELASVLGAKVVYISTDYVYEGATGNYKETDAPKPSNFYSFTKLAGESYLDDTDLIIRTSFKPNIQWPYPKAFEDIFTSADYVDVIAPMINKLVSTGACGVFNVGTERKTVHQLAIKRNPSVSKMSKHDVVGVSLPYDVSMNLEKYNALCSGDKNG